MVCKKYIASGTERETKVFVIYNVSIFSFFPNKGRFFPLSAHILLQTKHKPHTHTQKPWHHTIQQVEHSFKKLKTREIVK